MTVVCHHTGGCGNSTFHNVTHIECDGEVVAIHYFDKSKEPKTAYYDLGYDPKHGECTISAYEVTA